MHPDTEDLIQRITRPLEANAELHLAARSHLLDRVNEAGDDEEGQVAAYVKTRANEPPERSSGPRAVTSAATQIPGVPPKHWRAWFYLAVAMLVLALAAPFAWKAYETAKTARSFSYLSMLNPGKPYQPLKIRNLPQKSRVILLGDESLDPDHAEKWRALWKSDAENPVFLAQYAKTHSSVKKSVSPEILETAARIDPDNGLYPLIQATSGWDSVIKQTSPTPVEKKAGKRKEWMIMNETALDERVALLQRVVRMPGIQGYELELLKDQLAVLPPPEDLTDVMAVTGFKAYRSAWFNLLYATKLLSAKASACAKHGDIEGFRAAVSAWKSLCMMAASRGKTFLDALITRAALSAPLEDFRDGAQQLKLDDEARGFDEFDKRFKQMRTDEKSRSRAADPTSELVEQKGSTFFSLSAPVVRSKVRNPTPISADDLRPGRYADHALFGRSASMAAAVIFLLLAGIAALCRFRQSALIRVLSPTMTGLLRVSDCLWIIGLGVIAPIAWFLTIQFLTPLGAREWSLRFSAMILPGTQFCAAVLLVIVATLVTAGWRLGGRVAVFGLHGKRPWIGWTVVAILVLSIPAIGALPAWPPARSETGIQVALAGLLGLPVLWLGISLLLNLVNSPGQSLRRATLARMMIPAWMFAAAAFACLIPLYHQSEKHWFKNDLLTGLADPEVEFTRYEMELAKVLHKELRELMDTHFQPGLFR